VATPVRYRQVQRALRPWLGLLALVLAGLAWWAFVQQVVLGVPFGTRPAPDAVVGTLFVLFGLAFPVVVLVARLVVEVRAEDLLVGLVPFARRIVPLERIRSAEAVTYRPVREYGGWGVRWLPGRWWAWTARGNRGVRLVLDGGEQLLLGSDDPEALTAAILAARDARVGAG